MAQIDAPDNERTDVVLVAHADGTTEELPIPNDPAQAVKVVALSDDTIEKLGEAIGKAIKSWRR